VTRLAHVATSAHPSGAAKEEKRTDNKFRYWHIADMRTALRMSVLEHKADIPKPRADRHWLTISRSLPRCPSETQAFGACAVDVV